jgi:bacterioferritin (cytochrome b1)
MPDTEAMDVDAPLRLLNVALRLQRRSADLYAFAAAGLRGDHALTVSAQLWQYAQAEFGDVGALISKIVTLDGQPDTTPEHITYTSEWSKTVDRLIQTEQETVAAMHTVIPATGQEPRSEALEHLMEHMIMRKQTQLDVLLRVQG